jgi:hydrogenase/urease accessory protein HupE
MRARLILLRLLGLVMLGASFAAPALAHEVRPALLQIREIGGDQFDILWKTPAQGDMRLALDVQLPEGCESMAEPRTVLTDGAVIARWREACPGGLVGQTIGVPAIASTLTDAIVRYEPLEGRARTLRLTPDAPSAAIPARQPWPEVARTYFVLGVEHILLGFDHLLFVLALLILVRDVRRLLAAVTAFTAAHTLTLAGTTFGLVKLPSAPVEASIALSIAFLAAEILRTRGGQPSLTQRWPWIAAFGFGLLHGFGFAGALREIGLPEDALALSLLFFNLGVEAGQVVFILAVLALVWVFRRLVRSPPVWLTAAPAWLIGIAAGYWFVERTVAILAV